MATSMKTSTKSENIPVSCEIEGSVVTGFEKIAKDDIQDKFDCPVETHRGHVTMTIPICESPNALDLQCVDNLYVIIYQQENMGFTGNKEEDLKTIRAIVPLLNWQLGLEVWSKFIEFLHPVAFEPQKLEVPENLESASAIGPEDRDKTDTATTDCQAQNDNEETDTENHYDPSLPKFRASCNRTGSNHSFQSPDVSVQFGGAIQDYFGWNVDLKNHDIEVIVNIIDDTVRATIALTKSSLHRRDITNFGQTTLRATIAYNMLRMCAIQPGEVVCDPMCGTGAIPIQAAKNWSEAVHMCGDIQPAAVAKCQNNVNDVNSKRQLEGQTNIKVCITRWDVTNLPLKDNCVDVFITDLPFGKRSGSKFDNRKLYPDTLKELARVCKQGTGRICLLTHDRRTIQRAMHSVSGLWKRGRFLWTNIGGLTAGVFMLHRLTQSNKQPTST